MAQPLDESAEPKQTTDLPGAHRDDDRPTPHRLD